MVLEQALREEGCQVTAVKQGQAGIDALQAAPFDCVITDLRMPGMDGLTGLALLRSEHPTVPIIVLPSIDARTGGKMLVSITRRF